MDRERVVDFLILLALTSYPIVYMRAPHYTTTVQGTIATRRDKLLPFTSLRSSPRSRGRHSHGIRCRPGFDRNPDARSHACRSVP